MALVVSVRGVVPKGPGLPCDAELLASSLLGVPLTVALGATCGFADDEGWAVCAPAPGMGALASGGVEFPSFTSLALRSIVAVGRLGFDWPFLGGLRRVAMDQQVLRYLLSAPQAFRLKWANIQFAELTNRLVVD